jgi:hypothetical protein
MTLIVPSVSYCSKSHMVLSQFSQPKVVKIQYIPILILEHKKENYQIRSVSKDSVTRIFYGFCTLPVQSSNGLLSNTLRHFRARLWIHPIFDLEKIDSPLAMTLLSKKILVLPLQYQRHHKVKTQCCFPQF